MLDSKSEPPLSARQYGAGVLAFLLIAAVFYIYSYNSGYGYDGSEYLVLGRSLLDGFRISTFILSKGWASYTMTAAALALLPAQNHAWISLLITVLFLLAVGGTWWVGRRFFGARIATWSALLVAVCAFFMELNFLVAEIPVYCCGLLAVYTLEVNRARPVMSSFLAGCCLGLGFAFKAVALFYLAGIFGHLLFTEVRYPFTERLRRGAWISLGFGLSLLIPACYFAATGQLQHHLQWSYLFPMLHFPANTYWLRKLYTKLLWFFALLAAALFLATTRELRGMLFADTRLLLILWMGSLSLLSLVKSQASHFVFPGAAFLSFFISQTFYSWWSLKGSRKAIPIWVPTAAALLVTASAYLYSPSVFGRFLKMRDFSEEDRLVTVLGKYARPEDRVLFLQGGVKLYWAANRYPNLPFMNTDVQTSYLLSQKPELLDRALDDPKLALVEFDPQHLEFDDARFLATEHNRNLIHRFSERLQERFTRIQDPEVPLSLWVRRAAQP